MLRTRHGARPPRRPSRLVWAGLAVSAVSLSLTMTGVTSARLSGPESSGHNSFTAATISAPTGFTATATSSTTVKLSWTGPSTLTGYTLSQSSGTLAGCSATPPATTTTCTVTGLSAKTPYTWTLTAVYNNWKSSSVPANATTFAAVGKSLLGMTTDTNSGTQTTTVSTVNTTSGADLLILIYRQASNGNLGISTITGSAINGTPAQIVSQVFNSNGKYEVWAYHATGTGISNGSVAVKFSAANNTSTTIDVVQLSGDNTASPIAGSQVSSGTSGTTATGGTLSPASPGDAEVFFAGLSTSTTMSTPSGYTALDVPASGVHGAWFSPSASSSGIATTLGTSTAWGTIEIEIAHG